MRAIERLMIELVPRLLSPAGRFIYKMFGTDIKETQGRGISDVGSMCKHVDLAWTELSSSFTSELYLV